MKSWHIAILAGIGGFVAGYALYTLVNPAPNIPGLNTAYSYGLGSNNAAGG